MGYTEGRSHFERARLNTVDKGVIEMLDGLKHSCEEITVTTSLNHKVKVRMKNLGDDVWGTTLVLGPLSGPTPRGSDTPSALTSLSAMMGRLLEVSFLAETTTLHEMRPFR